MVPAVAGRAAGRHVFGFGTTIAVLLRLPNLLSPRFDTMLKMLRRNAVPSKASACFGGMN
jgi:hypothetical protein